MAATVPSVWGTKPGAWALDAEEHEEELKRDINRLESQSNKPELPSAEFPSLSAAASTATKTKKKKGQTLSLADFNKQSSFNSQPQRLTPDELLTLPTAPRQRSADESDDGRLGGGFRNYGGSSYRSDRSRVSEREGYNGNSSRGGDRDMGPSRADEVDDWSKTKKVSSFGFGGGNGGSERRERGGFFNSSRADDVDNWASNKSFVPSDARRERRSMGFESAGGGADSENWAKNKGNGGGFERERRGKYDLGLEAGAADSDNWLKRKEEKEATGGVGNGRPRLNLQPRTAPVINVSNNTNGQPQTGVEGKPKGSNPFGAARPREEVLAEKGKDWREIDEKLEAMKVKELSYVEKGEDVVGSRRTGFGMGRTDDRVARSWRRPESNGTAAPPADSTDSVVADDAPSSSSSTTTMFASPKTEDYYDCWNRT